MNDQPFLTSIIYWPTRTRFDDMEVLEVYDGSRDKSGVLAESGGVLLRPPNSKKNWFVKFSEFSFLFPGTQPQQ